MSQNVKKRNWAFVLYPESAPENWKQLLQESGLQAAISPLHDKDLNATGEPKKPHWHVIVCYSGPTSYNVVCKLSQDTLKGTIPQALEQVRGYYRYLTHKDNPEKAQYNEADIKTINGFNIMDFMDLTKSEVLHIKLRIHDFIEEYDITEYNDLMVMLRINEMLTEYDIASTNTMFFNSLLKSRKFKYIGGEATDIKITPKKGNKNANKNTN